MTNNVGGSAYGYGDRLDCSSADLITNPSDFGPGTFRDALSILGTKANPDAWTIAIDPSLAGQKMVMTAYYPSSSDYTAFVITNHVRIDGSTAPGFILAVTQNEFAGPPMRHFRVASTGFLELMNLTLADGKTENFDSFSGSPQFAVPSGLGGAIFSTKGMINFSNVVFFQQRGPRVSRRGRWRRDLQ